MNDTLSPAADDSAALKTPRKRAVKKTAASAAAPEAPAPPPPAAKAPAKKAAVKKKAAPAVVEPVALPVVTVTPPPAKKTAAKKATAKRASSSRREEASQPLLPLTEPTPAPVPEKPPVSAAAPAGAPKKKTARKTARAVSAEPESAPSPEPVAEAPRRDARERTAASSFSGKDGATRHAESENDAAPPRRPFRGQTFENRGQNRHPLLREHAPRPAGDEAQGQEEGGAPPAADHDGAPPRHGPRQEGPPRHRAHDGPPRHEGPPRHDGDRDNQVIIGPDGQPRRLNKWERWKQRKEKFKLLKQQRYLERHAGGPPRPGPGQGDGAAPPEGPVRHERERERGHGPPHPHGPRQDGPRQEHPPRPEPQLGPPEPAAGLLEFSGKGIAFLRPADRGFAASPADTFVSPELIRQHGLREGVMVEGVKRRGGRGPQLVEITSVNGMDPNAFRTVPLFEELTAINPNKRYVLETEPNVFTTRLIDFIAPIGRGQRGLIVAPPRAGKTTILQHVAEAVLQNYESVKVIVLLVDERPEEVTELARALPGAEIMASSNDQDPRNHIRMAQLAVERAKRIVETGGHVFMLLDSITRLARAFNNAMRGGGGKAMSGGIDSRALELPRKLFAAARNTREAGSLTILATALVETNNKGDDLIFQEFKGTGNMELVLDRKIAQQYVYPAVDMFKSGTRREELLLPAHQLEKVHLIRRGLAGHRPVEAMERLLHFMKRFPGNAQMLVEIKSRE